MPIYEYFCHNCEKKFDVFVRNGDEDLDKCPDCGKQGQRILSPVYSNFTSWSETLDRIGKWSTAPEDFSQTADGR